MFLTKGYTAHGGVWIAALEDAYADNLQGCGRGGAVKHRSHSEGVNIFIANTIKITSYFVYGASG